MNESRRSGPCRAKRSGKARRRAFRCASHAHDEHPWLLSTRERLHSRFLRAFGHAADVLGRACLHDETVECLQRGLEADPLVEETYRRLMRAQLACDHRSEALATYRRCRKMLAGHFSLAPSPDTEALRRRIEAG